MASLSAARIGLGLPPRRRLRGATESDDALLKRHALTRGADGRVQVGPGREFAVVPPGLGLPDGLAVDEEDHVWVALWGGRGIVRLDGDGGVVARYALPVAQPTSVTLLGSCVLVKSALEGLDRPGPLDGATLRLDLAVAGPPVAPVALAPETSAPVAVAVEPSSA